MTGVGRREERGARGREGECGVVLQQHSSFLRGVSAASRLSKESSRIFNEGNSEELFTEKTFRLKQPRQVRKSAFHTNRFKEIGFVSFYKPSRCWINK